MGVPVPDMNPADEASTDTLLSSLRTIAPAERRKHASVFNYWLSIRRDRQFPPIRDLDPLEISDAGPFSLLLEMVGGGEDAEVRHIGQAIKGDLDVAKVAEAPNPSLLSCVATRLPVVAACREAFAFEDSFETDNGTTRCWVTLLPFSANGTWIDFVYGYVSLGGGETPVEGVPEQLAVEPETAEVVDELIEPEPEVEEVVDELAEDASGTVEEAAEDELEPFKVPLAPLDQFDDEPVDEEPEAAVVEEEPEPEPEIELVDEYVAETGSPSEPEPEVEAEAEADGPDGPDEPRASFTDKVKESLASVGFYGKVVQSGPELPAESFVKETAVEETTPEPAYEVEGSMQSKLADVRALAEEAHQAQVRSNLALYEGLSAAYDFALDAENKPDDYLKLVEAQGLKIQLRSPMKPVVRLAFEGMCDDPTIAKLEAVLAWALKQDLPRGSLRDRIEAEGGLAPILRGEAA